MKSVLTLSLWVVFLFGLATNAASQDMFEPAVNYGAGDGPISVYAADLDGDGDDDLAVANFGSDNVSILTNNGDGTFASAVNYGVGDGPSSVYAADLDGDGNNDLAVANRYSDNVSILKNNGDGTFASAVNYGVGDTPCSVYAADLDGDGDDDLAVANRASDNVSILKNNGDGTFASAVNYGVGDTPYSVYAADLDGDGDADLAVTNYYSNNVSILMNNGDGTFASAVNYGAGYGPFSVYAADLDGDGDDDLAVANGGSDNVSILKNNGDGTFASAVNYAAGIAPFSVYAADLDGDGDDDLAVANYGSFNVSILKNNGDGTFASAVSYGAGINPYSVCAADLDEDGDDDLAVANINSDNVSILINLSNVGNNQQPVGHIDDISPNPAEEGQVVTFQGTAGDVDGMVVEWWWESDIDGRFGFSEDVSYADLSAGTHQIMFKVKDDSGAWSAPASAQLEVSESQPPDSLLIVSLSPNPNPDISSVMEGGYLHRYYLVVDGDGLPQPGISVVFAFDAEQRTFVSHSDGILMIGLYAGDLGMTPGETKTVTITTVDGQELDPSEQIPFDVKLERRKYEKYWDVLTKASAEGGLQYGAGIGPLGIRGAQLGISGRGGVGIKLKLLKAATPSGDVLVFARRCEGGVGLGFAVGKITATDEIKVLGGVEGDCKIIFEANQEFTYDHPYPNEEQQVALSALLLETLAAAQAPMSPAVGPVLKAIIDLIILGSGAAVQDANDLIGGGIGLEGAVSAGLNVKLLGNAFGVSCLSPSANASVLGGINEFTHSLYHDQHPGKSSERFVTVADSFDVSILEFNVLEILPDEHGLELSNLLPHYGYHYGGSHDQRVWYDADEVLLGGTISITADNKPFTQILGETHLFETVRYVLPPTVMQDLIDLEVNLMTMAFRPATSNLVVDPASMNNDYSLAAGAFLNYLYDVENSRLNFEKEEEETVVYDASVSIPFNAALGAGIYLDVRIRVTLTDSRKYLTERASICNVGQRVFPLEEYYDDSLVQSDDADFAEICTAMIAGTYPLIRDGLVGLLTAYTEFVEGVEQTIIQTGGDIIDGGAQLVINPGVFVDGTIGQIVAFIGGWPKMVDDKIVEIPYTCSRTVVLTLPKALQPETTTVVVTAVGRSYQVDMFTLDSVVMTEYPAPLDFKIVVTDDDLAVSGFSPSYRANLGIHRWDSVSASVVRLPSQLSGDTVISQIIKGGQYFAGIDTLPPDTIKPSYNYLNPPDGVDSLNFNEPFEIGLVDSGDYASGLNMWSLLLVVDGDTVNPEMTISDPYSLQISWTPQPYSMWSAGTHLIHVGIEDNYGNAFTLDKEFACAIGFICGDIDGSGILPLDISDLVYLVTYMFQDGPEPPVMEACNVDGSAEDPLVIDIGDLIYLVNFMYQDGPALQCL